MLTEIISAGKINTKTSGDSYKCFVKLSVISIRHHESWVSRDSRNKHMHGRVSSGLLFYYKCVDI